MALFVSVILLSLVYTATAIDYEYESLKTYKTLNEYMDNEDTQTTPAEQILMTDEANKNGAYCLDGSVPDFYYRTGSGDGTHKYHMYLQGGGWCASIANCVQRAGTDLGSSKYDSQYLNVETVPYMSSNKSINPLTYNWNTIYIRYCDGSSYSGNNETIYKYNATTSLHFRGWRILNGVLNVLNEKYGLSSATDVLLSGCSAGALGVFFHADYVYETILDMKVNGGKLNYMSMPDAGYFMEVNNYIIMMQFNWDYGNLSIALNQNCVNYYEKNQYDVVECMYALNIAPFLETKMFSIQSQYDINQIKNDGTPNATVINEYGKNLTFWYENRFINTSQSSHMHIGWLVSCYQHCTSSVIWNAIDIDGYTVSEAQVNAWYGNSTKNSDYFLFQNAVYPCNTCCST